ncbi:MAG: hypothetical protein ACIAQ0_14395 [Phycisphaerales bacterium JB058]
MANPAPNPDPNEKAAEITRKLSGDDALPADIETAWAEWSKGIKGVDERGWTLLRAAFEAGVEAAASNSAASLGRKGGLKGGKARAETLSPETRKEIARKAAMKRWEDKDKD